MNQLKISKQITNRDSESVDRYLLEIGKLSLISTEEEVDLARRVRAGDAAALDKLTRANLRFVVSVAKQYQNRGLPLNDLINEGNVGLIKAGLRFDETRGFKFISYAVWWIRQSIIQAISVHGRIVRLPLNRVGALNTMLRVNAALEQRLEREPTSEELAECLGTTSASVTETTRIAQRSISADAPTFGDDNTSLLDTLPNVNSVAPDMMLIEGGMKQDIKRVLSTLPAREMQVLELYYGLDGQQPHTLEEIADRFSITRERVRQIKEHATRHLRTCSRSKALRGYLG